MTSTSVHEIKTLVMSCHPVIAIETVEEGRIRDMLVTVTEQLDLTLFEWSITRGLTRSGGKSIHGTAEPAKLLRHLQGLTVRGVFLLKDFSRHLADATTARFLRDLAQAYLKTGSTLVLTGQSVELPKDLKHKAVYYDVKLPEREEYHKIVTSVVRSLRKGRRIEVQTNGEEYEAFLRALRGLTLNQVRQTVAYAVLEDGKLSAEDVRGVLGRKVQLIRDGGLLEYYPYEENHFLLGGFGKLKDWLGRARHGFSADARRYNLSPPRGALIVGVQGCGKSLAAKFIARQWMLPLLKLDAGRLFDKYIGESEKNFRKACSFAESMAPVVLWIDEIEKGISSGGGSQADAGLSRRLFGAFLTWLQEKQEDVFVVATANDLSILPPELLRKGRFDEVFFVDLPRPEEREAIFRIHLQLHNLSPDAFDLERLVGVAEGYSGAEIEQAVISSLYRALHMAKPPDTSLLLEEIRSTVPLSVSRREDIEALRETARNRFVPVS